ncbi:MAG: hypothetical protein GY737_20295 [Desulfobacteraceae bacterium]|nr:hypothetical protein [Desulfobacteraceae bacterium]
MDPHTADITAAFLNCFAESVVDAPPVVFYMPQGPLKNYDINILFNHFLYRTPRVSVLSKFAQEVGYAEAFNFLLAEDPMMSVRKDGLLKDMLRYIYQKMARLKCLTWGVLDDAHFPQVVFYLQDPPNYADGSDGDGDTSNDDDSSSWWSSDEGGDDGEEQQIIIGGSEGDDTEEVVVIE